MDDDDLIRAHADLVYGTCLRITGNAQDAADASQEVFLAWMSARGTVRGPLAAWLHGTARQRSLDLVRRAHRRHHHEAALPPPLAVEPPVVEGAEHLDACLAELDPRQRTLVIEHHVLGLDQGALATRWGTSQATVSRHLSSGMEHLRRAFRRRGVAVASLMALLGSAQAATPPELWTPLRAQAHVHGPSFAAGGRLVHRTWGMVIAWGGAVTAALVLVAVTVVLVLRPPIPTDPLVVLTPYLPPPTGPVTFPPEGCPRWPMVEAYIARLPAMDAAVQARIRDALTRGGTTAPMAWWHPPVSATTAGPLTVEERDALAALRPLLDAVASPRAVLGIAGWVAQDYREGRLRSERDILDLHWRLRAAERAAVRLQEVDRGEWNLLIRAAGLLARHADADPRSQTDLDHLVAAVTRIPDGAVGMVLAGSFHALRDRCWQRRVQGAAGPDGVQAWLAESWPGTGWIAWATLGEALLNASHWRSIRGSDVRWTLEGTWRTRLFPGRMEALWGVVDAEYALRMASVFAGRDRRDAIEADIAARSPWHAEAVGDVVSWSHIARMQGAGWVQHVGSRLAVAARLRIARGRDLPPTIAGLAEGLDPVITAALGGDTVHYGLRYERLDGRRCRIVIDPQGPTPTFVEGNPLPTLAERSIRSLERKPPGPLVSGALSWSVDGDAVPTAGASDDEPLLPLGIQ